MIDVAVLMCHAPIVIPEIGGARSRDCAQTTDAMRRAAACLVASQPDVIVVVSPHTPRQESAWGISGEQFVAGTFARFGAPHVGLQLPGAPEAAQQLHQSCGELGLPTWRIPNLSLDHGALVPLHFVFEAGYRGPVLLIALPMPEADGERRFGRALEQASRARGERWAVLASGDMSHRLQPDAPAGYHPSAGEFDARFVALLRARDYRAACSPDPVLQELAAEDVIASVRVACGATGDASYGAEFLSYEGPFGVGYAEAILTDSSKAPPELLDVARRALRDLGSDPPSDLPRLESPWDRPRAVFVTLRDRGGELRGCIGQLCPSHADLVREVWHFAQAAATKDPRFPRVAPEELAELQIEVSVLEPPSPVRSPAELDPERYGVVVSSGARRGVLLPNVEGVKSAAQQLQIACSKAGIAPRERYEIERFLVRKVTEESARVAQG